MLHRRLVDHGCRVDQGYQMDDTHRIVKTLRLFALPSSRGLSVANRLAALRAQHPVSMFFTAANNDLPTVSLCKQDLQELPPNVHLHTFRTSLTSDLRCSPFPPHQCVSRTAINNGTIELLVRLQHIFSADDDPKLSEPAQVNLFAWLSKLGTVSRIDETKLTAAEVIRSQLRGPVRLDPMQLRTFIVELLPR